MCTETITTRDETDTPFSAPLVVSIWHDEDTDSPNDHDGLFRLVSFNTGHRSHEDPERVLPCTFVGTITDPSDGEEWPDSMCNSGPHAPDYVDPHGPLPPHEYAPPAPIAAFLSYFEHGNCKWSRMGHGPADYGGFDTVSFAGVLLLTDDYAPGGEYAEWWAGLSPDEKADAVDVFLEEYTNWANGETYGYTIAEQTGTCPTCYRENDPDLIESSGGYTGSEYFAQELRGTLADLWDIEPGEVVAGTHFITHSRGGLDYVSADDILLWAKWADETDRKRRDRAKAREQDKGTCRHCGRAIIRDNGLWVDPQATGDDSIWRETCDAHDTFTAEHEPEGESNDHL